MTVEQLLRAAELLDKAAWALRDEAEAYMLASELRREAELKSRNAEKQA